MVTGFQPGGCGCPEGGDGHFWRSAVGRGASGRYTGCVKGIEYLVDDMGSRKAVVIDLAEHEELWEDFYDALLTEQRRDEPRESLEEVKKLLATPVE
jgi:hypothetical protein